MRNFSYYEAKKFLEDVSKKGIDIDQFDLEEFYDAKELAELLDVSDSTVNNWFNGRSPISKLGERAISYLILSNAVSAYKKKKTTSVLINTNGNFKIFDTKNERTYDEIATTSDAQVARYVQEMKRVLKLLNGYQELIEYEIEAREDNGEYLLEERNDLVDTISYIKKGIILSEENDKINEEFLNILQEHMNNSSNDEYHRDYQNFQRYCDNRYGKDSEQSLLIMNLLKEIKANFVLLRKDTKWVTEGDYKNFLAIRPQNNNFCIFLKDKNRKLYSKTFIIKNDRIPYVRFNLENRKQLDDAIRIINESLKNI
ncbi:MAG: helix-turn-helix domain-containing protein [Alphaproteobacteria bacterium]|nr:helix-turn-helix domain-containing protein [Alphaproteobacteria bacterium]